MPQRAFYCVFALLSMLWTASSASAQCPSLLYATDLKGTAVAGSKSTLIAAVERGERIRVGWRLDFDGDGKGELAHWADAQFLTLWEGEVFAQVSAIHAQRPQRGRPQVDLVDDKVEWRGLLASTGILQGVFLADEVEVDEMLVAITWCSSTPASLSADRTSDKEMQSC